MNRQHRTVLGVMIATALLGGSLWECENKAAADPCGIVSRYLGVCLDPGHGGPGACKLDPPCVNGDGEGTRGLIHSDPDTFVTEAWVNHEIVPLAADALESDGFYVRRTRSTITLPMELQERCDIANGDPNVDVFVSVHHEGLQSVYDTRTFYDDAGPTSEWNHRLAQALADGIDGQFHYGKQAIGQWKYVLRNTWMPGALTEASSLGHLSEALLMASEDDTHRRDEANGIRDGLFYYNWDTAPMFLTCWDRGVLPGFELSWGPVEGADGYVV
jgi:N-acetylmuramoyl-L-alanine amidase